MLTELAFFGENGFASGQRTGFGRSAAGPPSEVPPSVVSDPPAGVGPVAPSSFAAG
ncbi:hypothetical protein BH11MYX4_BH11MYX4_35260 [soil metagenome]